MVSAVCKMTCFKGQQLYKEGVEYLIDEKDPFYIAHFEIERDDEEADESAAIKKKGLKK